MLATTSTRDHIRASIGIGIGIDIDIDIDIGIDMLCFINSSRSCSLDVFDTADIPKLLLVR